MTPNEMSLDQCRDWLAEHTPRMERGEGYWCMDRTAHVMHPMHRIFAPGTLGLGHIFWYASKDQHPYPATLDGAAGAMPEGWTWAKGYTVSVGMGAPPSGVAWSAKFVGDYARLSASVWSTGNEILDRYRLAVAARMAMKETA